jgi:hypothetical protein
MWRSSSVKADDATVRTKTESQAFGNMFSGLSLVTGSVSSRVFTMGLADARFTNS